MTSTQANSTPSSGPAAESGRPAHRDWIPPIPRPLQRLFDATPLVTYPPNELPYRSPAPNDLPTLHVFITEAGAARGLPSFNPSCLKWQVGCFPISCLRGAPGQVRGPSSEPDLYTARGAPHFAPGGRSPFSQSCSHGKCVELALTWKIIDLSPRSRCSTQHRPVYKPRLPQRLAPIPPASLHLRPSRCTATPPHTLLSSRPLRTAARLISLLYHGPTCQHRNTRPAAPPPTGVPITPRQSHPQRLALRPLLVARQRAPPAQTLHHPCLAHQPRAARSPLPAPRCSPR